MLGQIRAFAKSPFATGLLALLVISFVIFGIRGAVTSSGPRDEVIKAGGRPGIGAQEFKTRFNLFKQQLEQQYQQPISTQDAVQHDLDRQVADELAVAEAFNEMLRREGVRPGDKLIVDKLRTIPRFFNQFTGQFDRAAYAEFLQQNNMTAVQVDQELRDEIAERQFVSGMAAGLKAPMIYTAVQAAWLKETRDFQWFLVGPKVLGPPVPPTDAQLNAFIKQNAQALMNPEMRQFSVVHFSAQALAPSLAVSDAEVQKRFDFEKDTLSSPEKRSFQEIPVRDAKQAAEVVTRLRAGQDPNAVAASVGARVAGFTDQPRAAVPDKAVAAAVFAMKPGEVQGPVKGDFGLAVVRLLTVVPGHEANLAENRLKIEAEVRKADAEQKAYQLVQKFDDLQSGGADMAAAAKAVGLTVDTLPPVTVKGLDVQRQPVALPPKVLQAAFLRPVGSETDPIDLGQGEYFVVRVDKSLPPAPPTLDQIRPKLTQYYMMHDAALKLQAKATALSAAIAKGQSMADAARSVGAAPMDADGVLRTPQGQAFSPDLLGRVFAAKPGQVVVGQDPKLGFVVAKLLKVNPAPPSALAPVMVSERDQVSKQLFDDFGQAARSAARTLVKPKVDYAKARQALGVDLGSAGPSGGAAPAGAPSP